MTLLRAVGHVLDNVDGKRSPALRGAVDTWWKEMKRSKPEPAIFWGFIEDARNLLIKEYALGFHRTIRGKEGPGKLNVRVHLEGARSLTGRTTRIEPPAEAQVIGELVAGHFKGRDERQVAGEAIEWWEAQLWRIDELVAKHAQDTKD